MSKFPSRKKQKMDAAKKNEKYNDSFSKNEEHAQKIAQLKQQSAASLSMSQSQKLRANMDFMKFALEHNLPHLDKMKDVAVKSLFAHNNETMPGANQDEDEVVVVATPSPNRTANITNSQGQIPLNQSELVLSSDSDSSLDHNFGTRSRSSLDTSDQTQKEAQV